MEEKWQGPNGRFLFRSVKGRDIFDEGAEFELLGSGFGFSEGPIWLEQEGCLIFTDFPNGKIYRWEAGNGVTLFSGQSNRAIGLAVDLKGRIVSCEGRLRRVAIVSESGSGPVVDRYQGKRLNSPNDVIVGATGELFFTDPLGGIGDHWGAGIQWGLSGNGSRGDPAGKQ